MSWCCCCCRRSPVKKSDTIKPDEIQQQEITTELPIKPDAIEELRLKLGNKDLVESVDDETEMIPETQRGHHNHPPAAPLLTEDGLILPRKIHNPVLENSERQNLHRELLFNQKIGKNVLNTKSELQKALAKHKDNLARKELEQQITQSTPELEKVIADRAKRLTQEQAPTQNEDDKSLNKEFLQARAKLRARNDSK